MIFRTGLTAFALILALSTTLVAESWSDASGKYAVEADFVQLKDGILTLKKTDGKLIEVKLERLNEAGRERAKELAAEKAKPKVKPEAKLKVEPETKRPENKPTPKLDTSPKAKSKKPEQPSSKDPKDPNEIDLAKVYFNGPTIGTVFAKVDDIYVGVRVLDNKRCKMSIYEPKSNLTKKYLKPIENRTIELTFNKKEFTTHDGKTLTVSGPVTFVPGKPKNAKNFWFTTDDPLLFEMVYRKNIGQLPKSFSVKFK